MKLSIEVIIPVFELKVNNGKQVVKEGADKLLKHIKENHAQGKDALGNSFGEGRTYRKTGQMIDAIHVAEGKGKNPQATVQTKGTHKGDGGNIPNQVLLKIHASKETEEKPYPPALFIAADKDLRDDIKETGAAKLDVEFADTGKEKRINLA